MPDPNLDDLVALLQSTHDPFQLARQMPVIVGGITDIQKRVRTLEAGYLELLHRVDTCQAKVDDVDHRFGSIEADKNDYKARVEKAEKTVADDAKKVDELDKRVRTVEGAVGKAASDKAQAPAKTPMTGQAGEQKPAAAA